MANRVLTRFLIQGQTTTGAGSENQLDHSPSTFQATVTGTGTVSATVAIEVSNDKTNWLTLGTITLSGTASATDGFFQDRVPWASIRGRVTAIAGTGAKVTLVQGWSYVSLG